MPSASCSQWGWFTINRRIVIGLLLVIGAFIVYSLIASLGSQRKRLNDALLYAAEREDPVSVKAFLNKGADPSVRGRNGDTALMWAAENGDRESVQALLDKGAYVNAKNDMGKSALQMATEQGHTEIVKLLKKAGARE